MPIQKEKGHQERQLLDGLADNRNPARSAPELTFR